MESGQAADPVAAAAAAAEQPDGEAPCRPGAPGTRERSDGFCAASPPARLASAAAGADDGQSGEDRSDGHCNTVRIQPSKSGFAQRKTVKAAAAAGAHNRQSGARSLTLADAAGICFSFNMTGFASNWAWCTAQL